MKKVLTLTFIAGLISLTTFGQPSPDLTKKWKIKGYIYLGMTFDPEENEKGDYLQFFENGTFKSLESGQLQEGNWELRNHDQVLVLSQAGEPLEIEIVEFTERELILLFEEDGESVKIKYGADL
ncbi:MAG: lipocalin family protein [Bacteroidota bacterium]